MKNRIHKFVSVILLIVYGALTLVIAPAHHHEIVSGSASEQTILQHDDAQNCKHRAIESHFDCTICSFISHTVTTTVVAVVSHFNPKSIHQNTTFFFVAVSEVNSTHTLRGPPQLLA